MEQHPTKQQQEKIIAQLQKLLRLTEDNGATTAEAQTAMMKVQTLMAKYHLKMLQVGDEQKEHVEDNIAGKAGKAIDYTMTPILNVIAKNFRCVVYGEWNYTEGNKKKVLRIVGMKTDIEVVLTVYNLAFQTFWLDFMEYSFKHIQGKRTKSKVQEVKKSFVCGFAEGLHEAFKINIAENSAVRALMVVTPKEVKDYMTQMATNRPFKRGRRPTVNNQIFRQGQQAGSTFGNTLGKKAVGCTKQLG